MSEHRSIDAFEPEWADPPGATIASILRSREISRADFAARLGMSLESIQRLLLGLEVIDEPLAIKLSAHLGSSERFWVTRENQFRADQRRLTDHQANLDRDAWAKAFPLREMVSLGWIANYNSIAEAGEKCLRFFGVTDPASWQSQYGSAHTATAFRMAEKGQKSVESVTAWLRWAELIAQRTHCDNWDPEGFRACLQKARQLTWQKDPASFLPRLRDYCARSGVAVVVARTPKGCPASGATRFLSPNKAILVMSFRYRSDDQFWFTFFHEAGHLLLHSEDSIFFEDGAETNLDEEIEANNFAESIIIPAHEADEFASLRTISDSVLRFARKIGIAPGLIVGQLQHRGRIAPNHLNWLKRRYSWEQIESDRIIP